MKFLPIENLSYQTNLSVDEVMSRLSKYIEPKKAFRFGLFGKAATKPYEGQIIGHSFEINRIINYRNSFLPQITGVIEGNTTGTTIKVKMRMHIFVIAFICFWLFGVGIAGFAFLYQGISDSSYSLFTFIPLGMLLFLYALMMFGFKLESSRSKKDLQNLFEVRSTNPDNDLL